MPTRNRLRDNPIDTVAREFIGPNFHFEIWARYFPTDGVEYHVNVINSRPGSVFRVDVQCELIGGTGDALKLNRATKARIFIDGENVDFIGVPPSGRCCGFASCGVEQISQIREIAVRFQGFKRMN